jgi:hypothetical protein
MYKQVYMHRVRRIYDIHLKDFLKEWLEEGKFSIKIEDHLQLTDNEVTAAFLKAASDPGQKGHEAASRIVRRNHFKRLYQRNPEDVEINPNSGAVEYVFISPELYFEAEAWLDKHRQALIQL